LKAAKLAAEDKKVKDATDEALAEGDKSAQESRRLEMELDWAKKKSAGLG